MSDREYLTGDEILGAEDDLPIEEIRIPEWKNKWVRIRSLSAAQRDDFEGKVLKDRKGGQLVNVRARLAALTLVGPDGALLFTEHDIASLGRRSAKAMDRIFSKAQELNGMTNEDVDELEGNSVTTPEPDSI